MAEHVIRITDDALFTTIKATAKKDGRGVGKQAEHLLKQALGLS